MMINDDYIMMRIIITIHLVGGLEPWNFMIFHSVGNVIGPQLTKSIIFQRRRAQPPSRYWFVRKLGTQQNNLPSDLVLSSFSRSTDGPKLGRQSSFSDTPKTW